MDWSERTREPHATTLAWYRALIAFRAAHPVLTDGTRPDVTADAAEGWISMARPGLRVVANLGASDRAIAIGGGRWRVALRSRPGIELDGPNVRLPGWSAAVFEDEG